MTTHGMVLSPVRLEAERRALQAVLTSRVFEKKTRLISLLEYICERYFEGDIDSIKEYSIATDVFRRRASFDQTTDSIVRVEFFRLRKRLRDFYDGEGADQPIEIVVAIGHYRPEFVDRSGPADRARNSGGGEPEPGEFATSQSLQEEIEEEADLDPGVETVANPREQATIRQASSTETVSTSSTTGNPTDQPPPSTSAPHQPQGSRRTTLVGIAAALLLLVCASLLMVPGFHPARHAETPAAPANSSSAPIYAIAGGEVRIRCGYSRSIFKDAEGNLWSGDRYFTGGYPNDFPVQHIARTRNPDLYLSARAGVFSYKIPLLPGTYELHLYFAETAYGPISTLGGGENSRVFNVGLNGHPLLDQFDIVSDAGANTADERVFRDIHPASDGLLHLDFSGSIGLPMINAIEILPVQLHQLGPIRMVAQNSFFVDKSGNVWTPDTYVNGGQLAADKLVVGGTAEPGLYAGERYGNFDYAIPVDDGSYKLTLYFSEKYWGSEVSKRGGIGSRVFDLLCNGAALTRRMDIFEETGSGRALVRTYHGLRPNAQGKLILSFVPDVNYASVDAIDVEQEPN